MRVDRASRGAGAPRRSADGRGVGWRRPPEVGTEHVEATRRNSGPCLRQKRGSWLEPPLGPRALRIGRSPLRRPPSARRARRRELGPLSGRSNAAGQQQAGPPARGSGLISALAALASSAAIAPASEAAAAHALGSARPSVGGQGRRAVLALCEQRRTRRASRPSVARRSGGRGGCRSPSRRLTREVPN